MPILAKNRVEAVAALKQLLSDRGVDTLDLFVPNRRWNSGCTGGVKWGIGPVIRGDNKGAVAVRLY